jgi:hypothetical protein
MATYKKQKEEELNRKESEWQQRSQTEKALLQKQIEESVRRMFLLILKIRLQVLKQSNRESEGKVESGPSKGTRISSKGKGPENERAELELTVQKKLQTEREKLSDELRKIEEQKSVGKGKRTCN